ncbi:MAG: lipid-binding SYLF domain-containing protein [Xanthomonadales bacterium]|nr:lipid-binding SYLF domain-containing protein [Xanthomonadales bacterium]
MNRFYLLCGLLLAGLLLHQPVLGSAAERITILEDAMDVMTEINQIPEEGIPESLLRGAEAIAIVPRVVKAGFVVGGRRGKGVIAVRDSRGAWSRPSFITLTGGSVGFQAGVQSSDVILVFKSRRSVEDLVRGKFTLGGDASVAAGPVGREARAATDLELKSEIYSYSRSRGLFAGVSLEGAALSIDHDANEEVYGVGVTPRKIFAGTVDQVPESIVDFQDHLEEQTAGL